MTLEYPGGSREEHSMDGHYDVIGTGAGGGTLARHLAPSGKRILLLERGDWLPREPANWSTLDMFVDGQSVFSTDVAGSEPNRTVPAWCPQPAIGMSVFMYANR
jgi:choline dehydrogenase-like flavoprotein